jgi:hypothetical protein
LTASLSAATATEALHVDQAARVVGQAEPELQPMAAGGGVARLAQERVPGGESVGVVRPSKGAVGIAQNRDRAVEHLEVGVAPADPAGGLDVTVSPEVATMLLLVSVPGTVVLVEHLVPHQPQIPASDEPTVEPQLVLGRHGHLARDVQDPQQGLEGRL